MTSYDRIGAGYSARRVADPRIAAHVSGALLGIDSVANIGAGAGSYELPGKTVVAIEPSLRMVHQRPADSAPAIQAVAESLPLKDGSVGAATAILTIHHWTDRARGLEELKRVARDRIVILTWDPDGPEFWLTKDYLPAMVERDRQRFPSIVRSASSGFVDLPGMEEGLARLRDDLKAGGWHKRHRSLLNRETLDVGYRLVIAQL